MARVWRVTKGSIGGHTSRWTYYVRVCAFTFTFSSVEEIAEYLEYYQRKIHPGNARPNVNIVPHGDHEENQSKFMRLPLYLREEPKRQKVVKALEKALAEFSG